MAQDQQVSPGDAHESSTAAGTSDADEKHSVLDDLGAEVTGIAFPVSICMVLTIALVRILHKQDDAGGSVIIAEAAYGEKEGDSAGQKLGGSLLNALVFVGAITVMTFVIVILFKYGCVRVIYGYMGFATFLIFFAMTGGILLDLAQTLGVHFDAITVVTALANFACVGSTILFFQPAPLALKQAYLMWTGVVVAFIFTSIPEWTTWVLLVAMALYDLFAVLTPRGPLQMLVNLAAEREEDIPALVYEAREVRRRRPRLRRHRGAAGSSDASAAADAGANEAVEGAAARPAVLAGADVLAAEHHAYDAGYATEGATGTSGVGRPSGPLAESRDRPEGDHLADTRRRARLRAQPLCESRESRTDPDNRTLHQDHSANEEALSAALEAPAQAQQQQHGNGADDQQQRRRLRRRGVERGDDDVDDPYGLGMPAGVKLGLGDFIFYSVLVGRASLYDWMTVYASFVAVISGLGVTLWLLAVAKKALPALPVSIALGIAFYFLTRWAAEPFLVPAFLAMANW